MSSSHPFRLFGRRTGTSRPGKAAPTPTAGEPICGHPGCGSSKVLPCAYQDRWQSKCGTHWCGRHVTFVGEVPCCPQHAPLLSAVVTASTDRKASGKHPTVPIPIQPEPGKGARNCGVEGCLNPDLWPCSYRDQDGRECGSWWCGDHVEFVGQNRFCHRHAGLVGSVSGTCAVPGCQALEIWICSYRDRHGRECGTGWCREHIRFVGAVPFCEEHAALLGTLSVHHGSVREIKTLPALDDRCASLAEFVSGEVHEEILAFLQQRYADRPDVQVMGDERVRDMWYQTQLVWWRTWGALTNAGYLTRIAIWIPMVAPPVTPLIHVLVDSNTVFKQVPDWIIREQRGEPPHPSDLPNFTARIVESVRQAIDMPAPYLVAGRHWAELSTPTAALRTPPPPPPPPEPYTPLVPVAADPLATGPQPPAEPPPSANGSAAGAPSTQPGWQVAAAEAEATTVAAAAPAEALRPEWEAPPPGEVLTPAAPPAAARTPARVLVVAEDGAAASIVLQQLKEIAWLEVVGVVLDPLTALDEAARLLPELTLIHLELSSTAALWLTERISSELPQIPVLLVSEDGSSGLLRRAHQAGARDVLVRPYSVADLSAAVSRFMPRPSAGEALANGTQTEAAVEGAAPVAVEAAPAQLSQSATALAPPAFPPSAPPAGVAIRPWPSPSPEASGELAPSHAPSPVPIGRGEVTVVFSGKGGVGKSLIATNLASEIAATTGSEVGLVDLDLQFGDLGLLLNVQPTRSISDVVDGYPDLDQAYVSSLMATGTGGVRLLAAPARPELADLVAPEHVKALLEMLRGIFRHTVVDLGAHLDDASLEAVQAADQIILVTDLDLPTIKNAQLALKLFDRLGIPADRVFVVLNRSDARTPVMPDQVEQHLLHPVAAQIPTETAYVQESVRRATPLVRLHPDAALSRAVRDLVGQIGCTPEGG